MGSFPDAAQRTQTGSMRSLSAHRARPVMVGLAGLLIAAGAAVIAVIAVVSVAVSGHQPQAARGVGDAAHGPARATRGPARGTESPRRGIASSA